MSTFPTRHDASQGVSVGGIAAATFFAGMAIFLPLLFWISTL